jgi:hypothetical protein
VALGTTEMGEEAELGMGKSWAVIQHNRDLSSGSSWPFGVESNWGKRFWPLHPLVVQSLDAGWLQIGGRILSEAASCYRRQFLKPKTAVSPQQPTIAGTGGGIHQSQMMATWWHNMTSQSCCSHQPLTRARHAKSFKWHSSKPRELKNLSVPKNEE